MLRIIGFVAAIAAAVMLNGCGDGGGTPDAGGSGLPVPRLPPTTDPNPALPAPVNPSPVARALWQPQAADDWQWQLHGPINIGYAVKVYDVDLVDAPQTIVDALHAQGRRVICYFSAGSSEDFRADYPRFHNSDLGNPLVSWPREHWLDIRSANVRAIMRDRLTLAASKNCDGVEPDNVDAFANNSGFPLTSADQLDYNRFLASEAHLRGLAIGLKNDLDQVPDLVDSYEYAVNEQCHEFAECAKLQPFTAQKKPVFNAEYLDKYVTDAGGARAALCSAAKAENIRTLVLPVELDDHFRFSCD